MYHVRVKINKKGGKWLDCESDAKSAGREMFLDMATEVLRC